MTLLPSYKPSYQTACVVTTYQWTMPTLQRPFFFSDFTCNARFKALLSYPGPKEDGVMLIDPFGVSSTYTQERSTKWYQELVLLLKNVRPYHSWIQQWWGYTIESFAGSLCGNPCRSGSCRHPKTMRLRWCTCTTGGCSAHSKETYILFKA